MGVVNCEGCEVCKERKETRELIKDMRDELKMFQREFVSCWETPSRLELVKRSEAVTTRATAFLKPGGEA